MAQKGTVELILEVNGKPAALEYQKLSKQLDGLIKEQSELNKESKEYGKTAKDIQKVEAEMKKLEPTISNLNKEKRKLTKSLKDMTIGSEEYIKTSERLGEVNSKLKAIRKETAGYSKEIKNAASGTTKMKRGLSSMAKVNPFALMLGPIGAIITGITALIGLFSRSEKGAKLLAQAQGAFNGVVSVAVKYVGQLGEWLMKAFNDPKAAIKEFGELLKANIQERIENTIKLVSNLSGSFVKFLKGDFKGATESFKEAGKNFRDAASLVKAETFQKIGKEIKESAKAYGDLALATRAAVKSTASLTVEVEKLATKEALLLQIRDDDTLSFDKRNKAGLEAIKVSEERAKTEIKLAKAQASILNQEMALRRRNSEDVNSLLEAQAGALAGVEQAERGLLEVQAENATQLRKLKQDEKEQILDILIDGYDRQKSINEELLNSDLLTFEKKKELFAQTEKFGEDSFNRQIEVVQSFTDANVDANDLINESDSELLVSKIHSLGLSEIVNKRLLEIVNERKQALIDLNFKEQELKAEGLERDKNEVDRKKASQEQELADELLFLELFHEEGKAFEDEKLLEKLTNDALSKEEQLLAEEAHKAALLELELQYLEAKRVTLETAGESSLAIREQIAAKEIDIAKDKHSKEVELEARTAASKKAIQDQVKAGLVDGLNFFIDVLSQDEDARKQNARAIKAFEIAKIGTNLFAEISAIWKNSNSNPVNALIPGAGAVIAGVQTGFAVGRAALGVANVRNQKFAGGGFTGGGSGSIDETGHKVAGVVHDGEWVAPKWMVQNPIFGGMITNLEESRLRGFAGGGFTSQSVTPSPDSIQRTDTVLAGSNPLGVKLDTLIGLFGQFPRDLRAYVTYEQLVDILDEGATSEEVSGF